MDTDCVIKGFYINLPIGAFTFFVITLFFKSPARQKEASIGFTERFKQFDPFGTVVFIPAIVCLLLGKRLIMSF